LTIRKKFLPNKSVRNNTYLGIVCPSIWINAGSRNPRVLPVPVQSYIFTFSADILEKCMGQNVRH